MFDQIVRRVMQRGRVVKAPPHAPVIKAAKMMVAKNVGAVMIVDERDELIGIFTERDIAFRVVAKGLDPRETTLAEVMTPHPVTIAPEKPFGTALAVMHQEGFRHLPVVEDGRIVGVISARSAMDPELEEFESEAQRRKRYLAQR